MGVKLGVIARMDKTGLGNQTRNLVYMLKPEKVLVINSSLFTGNKQYHETYKGFNAFEIKGFPRVAQGRIFMRGLDALLTCETFYTPQIVSDAQRMGVKTYNCYNYEFLDNLSRPGFPVPTKFLAPSHWMIDNVKELFKNVEYIPPPTDFRLFSEVRDHNFDLNSGTKRFLHIIGKEALHNRNGTIDLIQSLKYTKSEFELVIKTQFELDNNIKKILNDRRIKIDYSSPEDEAQLYKGFDALILPRRYGGLCLPMNEALLSGMPVIMTDISPNNKILPKKWLVDSIHKGEFITRTLIPYYSVVLEKLAEKIDWLCEVDLNPEKAEAFEIGHSNYSVEVLKPKYERLFNENNDSFTS